MKKVEGIRVVRIRWRESGIGGGRRGQVEMVNLRKEIGGRVEGFYSKFFLYVKTHFK